MKQFQLLTALLLVAVGKADVCQTEGSYIVDIIGKAYDAVDRIDSFKCSDGTTAYPSAGTSAGGIGGTGWEISDAGGYIGLKSGYWTLHSEAASGLSFMNSASQYLGPYGTVYDGVTERLCSGGAKMNGISAATATTSSGGFTIVGVNPLPSCTTLKYECPPGAVFTSIDLYSGDGVDNITHITCTDGSGVISGKDVNIGGSGGGAGTASGGPFLGMRIGSYDLSTSNVLAGLAFRKSSDGNYGDTFGIKPYNGDTYPYMCAQGQVMTGLNMPQVFYSGSSSIYHLVGASLTIKCGCQSIPNCTQQDTSDSSNCACTACAGGYVVNTNPSNFLTTCTTGPPTSSPTPSPTSQPTAAPTKTKRPAQAPTAAPTTAAPTPVPTPQPTIAPTTAAPKLFECPKGSIMKSINFAYDLAFSYISSFDCTIPSSTMVTTSTVQVNIGNPGSSIVVTVKGPFTQVKKGYYVTTAGVITDAASGVQLVNNYAEVSPRFGSRYGNVTTKKCSAGQVLSGLYIAAAAGGQMVSADLSISCAAPPTKNYQCGAGAVIDSITLYADTGINAITKFTCKDALGTITSKTVNVGKSSSGTSVTLTGPFSGFNNGYAVPLDPTDAASGLTFVKTGSTVPTYGTGYVSVTPKLCSSGQVMYGLTIGWDSSGTMVGGKMAARCRGVATCTGASPCICTATNPCSLGSQPGGGYYQCNGETNCNVGSPCTYACAGTFSNSHVACTSYGCSHVQFSASTVSCNNGTGLYPCNAATSVNGSVACDSAGACDGMTVSGGTASCNATGACNGASFTNNCMVTCNANINSCANATFDTGSCCVAGFCPANTAC